MGLFGRKGWGAKQGPKSSTDTGTVEENAFSLQPVEFEELNEV
jgi:hypothetical protein